MHKRFIPDDDITVFFRGSAVVVMPYIEASQSGVIPLAYAFGKPVVATRVGALPDIVEDGETGLLVEPGDADALARAIEELLENPDRRRKMGRQAHAHSREELNWDSIATTTHATYESVRAGYAG